MSFTIPLGKLELEVAFSNTGSLGASASLQFFKSPFQMVLSIQALLPFDLTITLQSKL